MSDDGERRRRRRSEYDDDGAGSDPGSPSGLGTVLALVAVGYLVALIVVNTDRVDVDLVVYTFQDTPLWWFTALVVVATLVVDRVVRWVLRRVRRRRD